MNRRTYADVMREASDNAAVTEPTHAAPEHDAPLGGLVARMREIVARGGGDQETDHHEADMLLIEALRFHGYDDLCDLWLEVPKWYA